MAWNGGVSLAVWMGGAAAELDAARRARPFLGLAASQLPPAETTDSARSTPALYEAMCLAFDRRLVIDILAGASAGGLNGCLLAGSIVYRKSLGVDFLRDKWIQIGDFGSLLQPLSAEAPASIMQGDEFYSQLRIAFNDLLGPGPPPETLDEVPVLLDVQATDVVGEERCFWDSWGEPLYAREYRSPLRFRETRDYTPGTLAAAARASASFPGAFEPQKLYGVAARLAGFDGQTRYAVDGGLLENAPIKPALELVTRRRANGPATRYVVYVDAAPTEHEAAPDDPSKPTLGKVLGYTFNLPREARVVDQLLALDDFSRRAGTTANVGVKLLGLGSTERSAIARTLLPSYRHRLALLSLSELIGGSDDGTGPRRARTILEFLAADVGADPGDTDAGARRLPWIPVDLTVSSDTTVWRWGVRAAQRVLQLEIDLLTGALAHVTSQDHADMILEARIEIQQQIVFLEGVYRDFASPLNGASAKARQLDSSSAQTREEALDELTTIAGGVAVQVWASFGPATDAFVAAYAALDAALLENAGLPSHAALFGTDATVACKEFVGRALEVEVVRRTFADDFEIESAESLRVAQLTPHLPTELFTLDGDSPDPAGPPVATAPQVGKDKLAGLRFGHFGGFYRSSWRENDFMWGRMDGASAIARLIVDPVRAKKLYALGRPSSLEPAAQLARALVPDSSQPAPGDSDRVQLLRELVPVQADLETDVQSAIEHDLRHGSGELTRAICARALQYEVLREEAPHLLTQLAYDREQGAEFTDLGWSIGADSVWSVVEDIRAKGTGDEAVPKRLGCDDPDEGTSQLGLRTLSQTVLVALSALAGVLPFTRALQPVRVPVLAVRGAAAERILDRLAVVIAFAGTSWYLVSRYLTVPSATDGSFPISLLWSPEFLAVVVSLLAVLGVVAVPTLRFFRTKRKLRKLVQGPAALAILALAGAVGFVWIWTTNSFTEALTTRHAWYHPPTWLLWVVAAAGGFQVASSLNTVMKWTAPVTRAVSKHVSRMSLVLGGVGSVLAVYAAKDVLVPAVNDWGMKTVIALLGLAAPAGVAFYLELPQAVVRAFKAGRVKGLVKVPWRTDAPQSSAAPSSH